MSGSTLYVTLEPSSERTGTSSPPITQLIAQAGIGRCVIGCADPVPEKKAEGAAALHSLGLSVTMGVEEGECEGMVREYGELANSKLHRMARKHYKRFNRVSFVVGFCFVGLLVDSLRGGGCGFGGTSVSSP